MNLINRPPPISPYSACRHAENNPTSAIITGTLLASTGGPAIPESKPAMVADRTAAAGAHGVDMSPAVRPTIGATTPSAAAPSKPAIAPRPAYSGPSAVYATVPTAT